GSSSTHVNHPSSPPTTNQITGFISPPIAGWSGIRPHASPMPRICGSRNQRLTVDAPHTGACRLYTAVHRLQTARRLLVSLPSAHVGVGRFRRRDGSCPTTSRSPFLHSPHRGIATIGTATGAPS